MGRHVVKTGFLGLGRRFEKLTCDRCGRECEPRFGPDRRSYCHDCANAIDPLIAHMWWPDDYYLRTRSKDFFKDTSDGVERLIHQCHHCYGLLVLERDDAAIRRVYYQVGSQRTSATLSPCVRHGGYDDAGQVRAQTSCEHAFIAVGTSKRMDESAHAKYAYMMSHRSPYFEALFETDEVDIEYACFGRTHYWCYPCGLYYSLNPQREKLLPKRGLIRN